MGIQEVALKEWSSIICEPPGRGNDRIQVYLDSMGVTAKGAGGKYLKDGDAQWCGAFAGFCAITSGVNPELVRTKSKPELGDLASTYRIRCLAGLEGSYRLVRSPGAILPGDIIVVGRTGPKRPSYGEHIVIATGTVGSYGSFPTVEGNALGRLGDGSIGCGVVIKMRPAIPTTVDKGFIFGLRFSTKDYQLNIRS